MRATESMRSQPVKKMPAKAGDRVFQAEKRRCGKAGVRGFAGFRKPPHPQKRVRNMGCHSYSVSEAAGPPERKTKWLCIIQSRPGLTVGQSPGSPQCRGARQTPVLRAVWPWASYLAPLIPVISLVTVLIPSTPPL